MEENKENIIEKDKGWRPTEYKEEFVIKAREYLDKSIDEMDMILSQRISNEKDMNWSIFTESKTTEIMKQKVKLPTIEWLAKYIWVCRANIYKWKWEHPEFSDILDEILEEQADRLINMGLSWDYNSTITKLLLMKHWYVEKTETEMNWNLNISNILWEIQWMNKKN